VNNGRSKQICSIRCGELYYTLNAKKMEGKKELKINKNNELINLDHTIAMSKLNVMAFLNRCIKCKGPTTPKTPYIVTRI
jgi:hypothetical protein